MKEIFEKEKKRFFLLAGLLLCLCLGACKSEDVKDADLILEGTEENTGENTGEDTGEDTFSQYPMLAIPVTTERIEFAIDSEGIYCIFDGSKFGYLTETGGELTPCIYDAGSPFSEGLACVSRDGKYGFIDKTGEEVLPLTYDDASPFTEGLAYFVKDGEYGFMTADGEVAFYLECDSVSSFSDGLAYFSIDGRYGYIDKTGQVVIEPIYGMADFFSNGYAIVSNNGYQGVIDKQGQEILPLVYDTIVKKEGLWVAKRDEVFEFYSLTGEPLFVDQYDYVVAVEGGYIVSIDGEVGYVNEEGEELIAPQYETLEQIAGTDYFVAQKQEMYGVVDAHGKEMVPFIYEWIYLYDNVQETGLLEVGKDGLYGCLSVEDFSIRIPIVYDAIGYWVNGYNAVYKADCWGIIDETGELQADVIYDDISILKDGSVVLKKDGEQRFYSSEGELLQTGSWEHIWVRGDFYLMEQWGKYVVLDKSGNEVLSLESDYFPQEVYKNQYAEIFSIKEYGMDGILKFADSDDNESIFQILLQNNITPKKLKFWELVHGSAIAIEAMGGPDSDVTLGADWYEETYYLYDIDNSGNPLLYYYAEPAYLMSNYALSTSVICKMEGDEVRVLVEGYECGGSLRGDYVCFWRDTETGQLLIGAKGATGGFGGLATDGRVYSYENGIAEEIFSYNGISWNYSYYSSEELLEDAELFYDSEGTPFTTENILEAEDMYEYLINGERVTRETYEEATSRYEIVHIKTATSYLK